MGLDVVMAFILGLSRISYLTQLARRGVCRRACYIFMICNFFSLV